MPRTLYFDIETHSADLLFSMDRYEFFRIGGCKWAGSDEVYLTTDLDEYIDILESADVIVGHNIHDYDLRAIYGPDSDRPLELAMERRVRDTWTHAVLVNPAPYIFTNRFGKSVLADTPEKMKRWFGLDEQAYQLGVTGKTDSLVELAFEFGDPSLPKKERIKDGFGKIPTDDERYRNYLIGDVNASEFVDNALLKLGKMNAYAWREQELDARKAVISSNGVRVDTANAQARVDKLAARREVILKELQERYDFPTEGKSPWATTEGKAAIMAALADHGITPETRKEWPLTATGTPSLGGEALKKLTAGTPAEEMGTALAELKGQRSLAQLALDSTHPDGFVHPEISMLQRSGRWSTTKPGLTIWNSRGPGAIEKEYFLPDFDDEVLLEIDYSNADARAVAAMSGDRRFAERFEPGADGHLINAWSAWGKDVVGTDKDDPVTGNYRFKAKALGHGWNYGGQAKTLSKQAGLPLEDGKSFCEGMNSTYIVLIRWQNSVRRMAQAGYVINDWGRKMWIEKGREFTQGPALMGQSTTREIVCDALLRMPIEVLRKVKAQVHDALLFSVPKAYFELWKKNLVRIMETDFQPKKGGQKLAFPVEAGPPGDNWFLASH